MDISSSALLMHSPLLALCPRLPFALFHPKHWFLLLSDCARLSFLPSSIACRTQLDLTAVEKVEDEGGVGGEGGGSPAVGKGRFLRELLESRGDAEEGRAQSVGPARHISLE